MAQDCPANKGFSMHILITGGTGFIGSRLALACLAQGDRVTVLGLENTPAEATNLALIEAQGGAVAVVSVTDRQQLTALLPGIDLVYHLAAAQHEANVPDQHFWEVNVAGTKNVIEASIAAGVKRFIHASTIGVYGSAAAGYLDEGSPLQPDNIYGLTKLEGEKLVRSYQDKIPIVIIRISETYGPGDLRLLKLFKAVQKRLFLMIGNGQNMHHPIYIDDLISGLFLAARAEKAVGQTLVLSGKEPISTRDMVQAIAQELGTSLPKVRAPLPMVLALAVVLETICRPLGIQPPLHRRRMDFFRKSFMFRQESARDHLGFMAQHSFKEGVAELAKWYTQMGYL
jgi:nucleoside-diphosphate-sugar epimerase